MEKIHFSIFINAPKEKVWHTMLDDATYRQWTEAFASGSHYIGNWDKGSKMLFLASEDGSTAGMVSRIAENRPYEFILIEHLGEVHDGKEDITSNRVNAWSGAHENYTFKEKDGQTEVVVDMDTVSEYKAMLEQKWPEALKRKWLIFILLCFQIQK